MKSSYIVFFRLMNDEQTKDVNNKGWFGSEFGKAYLAAEPHGEEKPVYDGAITFDLFELATSLNAQNKSAVYAALQNHDAPWTDHYPAFTSFPRSMSVGDIIFDRTDGHFYYVDQIGFNKVRDPEMIGYLSLKIILEQGNII